MEIVASLIKLFFGSKADKDRKQIEPYLEKIKAVYPSIEALSNDELRARSEALKKQIADFIARDEADIVELKAKLELPETSLEEKSGIYGQIYFFAANGDSSPQYFVVLKEIITFVRFTDTTPK